MHHTNTPYQEGTITVHAVPTSAPAAPAEADLDALVREVARCR
jgi:hypothetical protein